MNRDSYKKLFLFHLNYEPTINVICFESQIRPVFQSAGTVRKLSSFRDHYLYMLDNDLWDNHFLSVIEPFPIRPHRLSNLIRNYVLFFPVYASYLQMAKGEPVRFHDLVDRASDWLESLGDGAAAVPFNSADTYAIRHAELAADQRVKVIPSVRWQVFARDNWRCVSCGCGAHEGAILQADHITPRSKGGGDLLDNFQTLCAKCNSGKSNRDSTDLRAGAR